MATDSKPAGIGQVLYRRRMRLRLVREYGSLALRWGVLALTLALLLTQVVLITQAKGNGMYPAIKDGDLLFAFRLENALSKNDVVVYTAAEQRRVGRILGREGDVIPIDDSGDLLVNGTTQSGDILFPTYAKEGLTYPFVVPEGSVFLLGDYRTQCEDSRDFGPVPKADVEAKVITILRRRGI